MGGPSSAGEMMIFGDVIAITADGTTTIFVSGTMTARAATGAAAISTPRKRSPLADAVSEP